MAVPSNRAVLGELLNKQQDTKDQQKALPVPVKAAPKPEQEQEADTTPTETRPDAPAPSEGEPLLDENPDRCSSVARARASGAGAGKMRPLEIACARRALLCATAGSACSP